MQNCGKCKRVLTEKEIDAASKPNSGFFVVGRGNGKIVLGYCPSCLAQVAWLISPGEPQMFARITWEAA